MKEFEKYEMSDLILLKTKISGNSMLFTDMERIPGFKAETYENAHGFPLSEKYENLVFYTPIWEDIFSNDEERKEDIEQAKMIEENIKNSYLKFGYNLIEIPKGTISERVNFILSKL